jgi:hypothetical protein
MKNTSLYLQPEKGELAQLARAFDWQSKGRRFDSCILHKNGVSSGKSVTYAVLIQKTDTDIKPPYLNTYGGNLSKRWYIDYFNGIKRVREWIAANPAATRPERAEKRFQEIKDGVGISVRMGMLKELERLLNKIELRKKSHQTYFTVCKRFAEFFPVSVYRFVCSSELSQITTSNGFDLRNFK